MPLESAAEAVALRRMRRAEEAAETEAAEDFSTLSITAHDVCLRITKRFVDIQCLDQALLCCFGTAMRRVRLQSQIEVLLGLRPDLGSHLVKVMHAICIEVLDVPLLWFQHITNILQFQSRVLDVLSDKIHMICLDLEMEW